MAIRQLQVERRTGKVRQSKTNVLPLYYATNHTNVICQSLKARRFSGLHIVTKATKQQHEKKL